MLRKAAQHHLLMTLRGSLMWITEGESPDRDTPYRVGCKACHNVMQAEGTQIEITATQDPLAIYSQQVMKQWATALWEEIPHLSTQSNLISKGLVICQDTCPVKNTCRGIIETKRNYVGSHAPVLNSREAIAPIPITMEKANWGAHPKTN